MSERVVPGPVEDTARIREAVCVHTQKIYDSCRDKDCIEDLRVYPTEASRAFIENAVSVRAKSARLLHIAIDVEEITFNKGYYTVDLRFFYRIKGEAFSLVSQTNEISGLAVFDKRVILFGSEGSVQIFSSRTALDSTDVTSRRKSDLPVAVAEAVDPIILGMKIVDVNENVNPDLDIGEIPQAIGDVFESPLSLNGQSRRLYVTLGQFTIVRLERDTQLLMPVYDYCMPEKECMGGGDEAPCDLFRKIQFPVDEFFPPDTLENQNLTYREQLSR